MFKISSLTIAIVLCAFVNSPLAKLITITPSDSYAKIESAQAGDVVEIEPGTYRFRVYLDKQGTAQNPIIIRAQDADNRPVWDLGGQNCGDWPGSYTGGDLKRGAWQIAGSYYEITGIVIKNSQTITGSGIGDSSGIRVKGGHHVTIRNSHFEGNDNGVSGFGDSILYEYCVFTKNGSSGSGEMAHNIYLHGGTQTFRFCKVTDATQGQNIHLRGKSFLFEYCWIENEKTYMGDIMVSSTDWAATSSLDSTLTLIGCVIKGASNPTNDSKLFTMYNQPYRANVRMTINMYYNTIIGNGNSAAVVRFTDSGLVSQTANLYNNIFYGSHVPFRFDSHTGVSASAQNNWWPSGYDYSSFSAYMSGSIFGGSPDFQDAAQHDYHLMTTSQAAAKADTSLGALPGQEMKLSPPSGAVDGLSRINANDLGAFGLNQGIQTLLPPKNLRVVQSSSN